LVDENYTLNAKEKKLKASCSKIIDLKSMSFCVLSKSLSFKCILIFLSNFSTVIGFNTISSTLEAEDPMLSFKVMRSRTELSLLALIKVPDIQIVILL